MSRIADVVLDNGPSLRCTVPKGLALDAGSDCIVDAGGLLEYGKVARLDENGLTDARAGRVLRRATLQDQSREHENQVVSRMAWNTCVEKAHKYKLQIQLINVRYSFERVALEILFTAETRVDFKDMARELGSEMNTRVELRQMGVRDAAGFIGGMGPCGRQQCCCSWLHEFKTINVKLVKQQGISLNPTAISGMCGRLKCCMRYEHDESNECGRGDGRSGTCGRGPCPELAEPDVEALDPVAGRTDH